MERIEIYSSKKKSFLLLVASILFVTAGIYFFLYAENLTHFRVRSPLFIKGIGIASILFFGLGMYVSIRRLIQNQLILIIDKIGVNVNPRKSLSGRIEWKNIDGFSEITIHSTKIIVIDINNPNYWIDNEKKGLRKKTMEFNTRYYGSPFNIAASATQMKHIELMKILNDNLNQYKYNA